MPVKQKDNSFLFDDEVICVHFLPESKSLICGSIKGGLQLLHENGKSTQLMPVSVHSARISSIAHSGSLIVVASKDRSVSLWRWPSNRDKTFSGENCKLLSKLPRTRTWELPAESVDVGDRFLVAGHGIAGEGYLALWRRSRFDGQVPQRADLLEFEDVGVESVLILSGPGRASSGPTLVACGLKDGGVSLSSVEGEEGLIRQMRRVTLGGGGGGGGGGGEVSSLCRLPSSPYAFLAVAAAGGAFVVDAEDGADEGTKVISPFGDGDAGHLVGAAVARDGGGGGGGEDSSPSIAGGVSVFVLSGSGRLASVPAEAVFRAKIKKEPLDISSSSSSEVFPPRRISYRGPQRFSAALEVSRVYCVDPENWKALQFADFNSV